MKSITDNIKPKAELWFQDGQRLSYHPVEKKINEQKSLNSLHIWAKTMQFESRNDMEWATMMPGFPDGSFGWAATEQPPVARSL